MDLVVETSVGLARHSLFCTRLIAYTLRLAQSGRQCVRNPYTVNFFENGWSDLHENLHVGVLGHGDSNGANRFQIGPSVLELWP